LTLNAAAVNGNIAGNGITILAGSGANTISAPVILGGSQTWTNNSTNPLSVTGGITGTGLTLTTAGTGAIQIGNGGTIGSIATDVALVSNGLLAFNRSNTVTQGTDFASSISGIGGVAQNGLGTLEFSGANTYTGNTTVSAGTLNISGSLAGNGITTSGSILNVGTVPGQNAVVNINGGNVNTYYSFGLGTVANSGVLNLSSGS
jgi:autotransporter-associated beta strand protein